MRASFRLGLFVVSGIFVIGCAPAPKVADFAPPPPPDPTHGVKEASPTDPAGNKAKEEILGEEIRGNNKRSKAEGGLGLSGEGKGGGGVGDGVGLGSTGSIGHGAGDGAGRGYGNGQRGSVQGATATAVGSLDPAIIKRIVQTASPKIKACYDTALEKDPKVAGRLPIRFTIDPNGRVTSAAPSDATITEATFASCVVQCFQNLQFPQPDNGGSVVVTYPLTFSSE